jgi:cyanate lyase
MTREELTTAILGHLAKKGISLKALAEAGGLSPVFTTAAVMGQMALTDEAAEKIANFLDMPDARMLAEIPSRGSLGMTVPTDPLIYRFYEITQVYGTTLKALIEDEFGDGIMSAIDFDMQVERVEDPKGDRVQVTMSGKFLPFKKY